MAKLMRTARMGSLFFLASTFLFGCAGGESGSTGGGNPVANLLPGGDSWVMHQTSDMTGEQTSRFGPDGARVESPGLGVTYVVYKDPEWKVAVFCDKTQLIYEGTLEDLTRLRDEQHKQIEALDKTMNGESGDRQFEKGATRQIAGMNATEYFQVSKMVNPVDKSTDTSKTSFWVTTDIKVPRQALMAGSNRKTFGLPENGIPLRMTVENQGKEVTYLDTVSVAREPMPKSAFQFPKHYKHVKNEMDVVSGPGMAAGLNNLGKMLGEDEGSAKMDPSEIKNMTERLKRLQKDASAD